MGNVDIYPRPPNELYCTAKLATRMS